MDPAAGDQPICSEDGHRALVANGESYNFRSLRSRLKDRHRFQTQSDSEAVLALYAERGTACASDLDGMFAFALADGDEAEIGLHAPGAKSPETK